MQFKLVRITLLTLALTVLTSVGHAQQLNPFQRQIAQQGKQQERQYKQYMAITVDNLDRLCKLTAAQKKKLAIASKGAVERTMGKWKRQMVQMRGQFGGQFGGNFDVVAEVLVEEAEPAIADDGGDAVEAPAEADPDAIEIEIAIEEGDFVNDVQIIAPAIAWNGPFVGMGGMNVNAINSVAKEPIWTKAVAKTLTDKQKADFKQAQTKRRQFRRKSAVDNVIAKIDSELILSDDQRTKIGELVNKAVGHQFSMQQNGFTMDFSQANGMTAVQRIPKAQMAKLLSKTQMARWNEFRRQYGAPEQVMPGNQLLNWRNILGGFGLQ
jgi:hypothetical protein